MEHLPEFIANHLFHVVMLIAVLMLLFWNLFGTALSGIIMLTPQETVRMINHGGAVVLDVRRTDEFNNGHILGAGNIPAARIGEQGKEMAKYKGRAIILCCNTGNDSIRAGRILKMRKHEKIYCIKGGLQAWRTANLPLAKETYGKQNPGKKGTTDD